MIWRNPTAWLGLLTLLIPIAIHLLVRQQAESRPFPSLRFIPASRLASVRRRLISDWPLLLVRLALIALAVAALADPLWQSVSRRAAWNSRLARAIVVDTSASAGTREDRRRLLQQEGASVPQSAAQSARESTSQPGTGEADRSTSDTATRSAARTATGMSDQSTSGAPARTAAQSASQAPSRVATFETSDLAEGLQRAMAWLRTTPPARREIVVMSDFQIGALDASLLAPVPAAVGLRFVRVAGTPVTRSAEGQPRTRPVASGVASGGASGGAGKFGTWRPHVIVSPHDTAVTWPLPLATRLIGIPTDALASRTAGTGAAAGAVSGRDAGRDFPGGSGPDLRRGSGGDLRGGAGRDLHGGSGRDSDRGPSGDAATNAGAGAGGDRDRAASYARVDATAPEVDATNPEIVIDPFALRLRVDATDRAAVLAAAHAVLAQGVRLGVDAAPVSSSQAATSGARGDAVAPESLETGRQLPSSARSATPVRHEVTLVIASGGEAEALPGDAGSRLTAPWMADLLQRIATDEALTGAVGSSRISDSRISDAGTVYAPQAPWIVLMRDAKGRPAILGAARRAGDSSIGARLPGAAATRPPTTGAATTRAATTGPAPTDAGADANARLMLVSRLDAASDATALLIRATLRALAGHDPLPEAEVLALPDATLAQWQRPAGDPLPDNWPQVESTDRRWLWAAVLALLALEYVVRHRTRRTDEEPTHAYEHAA